MRQPTLIERSDEPRWIIKRERGVVHAAALTLVWITIAAGAFVLTEPAPVDALAIGLIILLPLIGLVAVAPMLVLYLSLWLVAAATAFFASAGAPDIPLSVTHNAVSLYLTVWSFVLAAFIAVRPLEHLQLVFKAYVVAALLAAAAGIIGYFEILPGAGELFTRYGRASGTFKDPNVYGPFMVLPIIVLIGRVLAGHYRSLMFNVGLIGLMSLAVLLTFSRGAWGHLAMSVLLLALFTFLTTTTNKERLRILFFGALGVAAVTLAFVAILSIGSVGSMFTERAALVQGYDAGPQGRFGRYLPGFLLMLDNPIGIGPLQFTNYFPEDPHNSFLDAFVAGGWLGGTIHFTLMVLTLGYGPVSYTHLTLPTNREV